ncbi:unnamed protein product [Lasius platythorax]|uniref:Uncharacterized protein n=1 Tax=Lasius platythorax TaxID=488582 RepID=A0AAV2P9T1_9HYME
MHIHDHVHPHLRFTALNDTVCGTINRPCIFILVQATSATKTVDSRRDGQSYFRAECNTESQLICSSRNRMAWFDDSKSGEQFEAAHSAGINSLSKLRASATRRTVSLANDGD